MMSVRSLGFVLVVTGALLAAVAIPRAADAQGLLGKKYGRPTASKKPSKKPARKAPGKKPPVSSKPVAKPKFDEVMAKLWHDIEADNAGPAGDAVQRAAKELSHAIGLRAGSFEVEDATSYVRFRMANSQAEFNRARVLAESAAGSGQNCRVANFVLGMSALRNSDKVNARKYFERHLATPGALQKKWAQSELSRLVG